MPRYICHYNGWFFEWSTVVDAPISPAMKEEEFRAQYYEPAPPADSLTPRLDRAKATGTSSIGGLTLKELLKNNRAGPEETDLSFREVLLDVGIPETDLKD